jgi:hypothetical protein
MVLHVCTLRFLWASRQQRAASCLRVLHAQIGTKLMFANVLKGYVFQIKHIATVTTYSNDHGYVPLVVNTSRYFPHSRLNTGFITRLARRVSLVEQELFTHPEHMNSPPGFGGVRVTRSLV